ncbi:MAG: hypothetical protein PHE24_02650 [Patescibacteria group bacterium]|nr:hypothetical protein [Patescibacteria group bacterium]
MNIVIDFTPFLNFFSQSPDIILGQLLFYFGWIPIAVTFLWGSFKLWIFYRQNQYAAKNGKYTLLAIDIPRGNEQSPKAVENLFAYLAGAHSSINLLEQYWEGKFQLGFSFEIISTGGYTQFLIRTPIPQRDLVESAVYAQYPDAEITEVDDYVTAFKDLRFPNDKYEIMGSEFILQQPKSYPIKTYEEFEHIMGEPETHFKDPMAALMDLCSSLQPGENLWYQMLVIPIGFDWMDELDKEVSKILGEKSEFKKNILHYSADAALGLISAAGSAVMGPVEAAEKKVEKKDDVLKMMQLKPKQKKRVEGIEKKSGKVAFDFKIRFVYLAEKEVYNKAKVFGGFVGFMKQFAAIDSNGLKPDMDKTATTANYLFRQSNLKRRKNRIFQYYLKRDTVGGRKRGLLNVEELATIWHFPNMGTVKAPLIQMAPGRKAEPPMTLPQAEEIVSQEKAEPLFLGELQEEPAFAKATAGKLGVEKKSADEPEEPAAEAAPEEPKEDKGAPPPNLPFV